MYWAVLLNWLCYADANAEEEDVWSVLLNWSSNWLSLFDRVHIDDFDLVANVSIHPNIYNHESGIKDTNQWLQ